VHYVWCKAVSCGRRRRRSGWVLPLPLQQTWMEDGQVGIGPWKWRFTYFPRSYLRWLISACARPRHSDLSSVTLSWWLFCAYPLEFQFFLSSHKGTSFIYKSRMMEWGPGFKEFHGFVVPLGRTYARPRCNFTFPFLRNTIHTRTHLISSFLVRRKMRWY